MREHPDQLESDFHRFYGKGVRGFLPTVAATLLAGILDNPDAATYRTLFPDWQWHLASNQLLAMQTDLLALLWWAKTRDGQKNQNRPQPVPRPGVPGYGRDIEAEFESMDIDALEATLALPREAIENPF